MQSKKHSLLESLSNVAIGYFVAVGSQILIFPFFGIYIPLHQNFTMGLWFTVISIARSYTLRRWFTKKTEAMRCRRCGARVSAGRCKCETAPSPWEPV